MTAGTTPLNRESLFTAECNQAGTGASTRAAQLARSFGIMVPGPACQVARSCLFSSLLFCHLLRTNSIPTLKAMASKRISIIIAPPPPTMFGVLMQRFTTMPARIIDRRKIQDFHQGGGRYSIWSHDDIGHRIYPCSARRAQRFLWRRPDARFANGAATKPAAGK